jgi:L-rhamnose-H+ transport protein
VNNFVGFSLTLIAGASVGISMWPLKWARAWKWENFWLYYAIFSLIVVPFTLAFAVLPHLGSVYAALSMKELFWPFFMGVLWGFAQLGAGICVHSLGIGVGGAVLNGTGAAFGTIIPLLSLHREALLRTSGTLILCGISMMLAGAAFCGWSGYLRELEARQRGAGAGFGEEQAAMRQASYSASAYIFTLGIAIGSGVLSALLNIALAYSGHILKLAEQQGAQTSWTPFAVWPIALLGGSLANIGYAVYLLSKNNTWGNFRVGFFPELIYPALSACLWMAGIALYSSGTTYLGSLGVSIGFAVFMITMIVSGQFTGLITGEWRLMKPRTYVSFAAGVGLLILAVLAIGLSKYFEA